MKILVTAFDPFGGDDTNSSLMVLNVLPDSVGNVEIDKMIIPTVYKECASLVLQRAEDADVRAILSLGQAGGRRGITVEVIGINYALSAMRDNNDVLCEGERLLDTGENALFATLPVKDMVKAVQDKGFEASLSASAGAFVCNSLLYLLLKDSKVPAGFVHLPYAIEQGKEGFAMSVSDMAECVVEMIKAIKNNLSEGIE